MQPFFKYTGVDRTFYQEHIAARIPSEIFDIHVHIYLPEHVEMVPDEVWFSNWAAECGKPMSHEDVHSSVRELYPDTEYSFAAFPIPMREADIKSNNEYLAELKHEGKFIPLMTVRPEWDKEEIEKTLLEGGFAGFKPYPGMAGDGTGNDVGIFDFLPHEQWEILNRHHKALMLHIPRKERFADIDNIKELLLARDKYPDVTIIIAHLGRSYCPYYLEEGLRKMGNPEGFYFDTTAVVNPEVYDIAFTKIPIENILYGSDMHVLLWHGKREWDEKKYYNLCRENFTWNKNHRPPEEEKKYTIFLYEQMRAILDAIDRHNLSEDQKYDLFGRSARRALGI